MEEHPQARLIVETLAKKGFVAYYAGGWVRDFLLNHPSDDIDIATNAPPEAIQTIFSHTVPIGIAFGIILVIIDGRQYEVATFRKDVDYKDGRRPTTVAFTDVEEDAKRRDFTINGMFYDPLKEEILDFVGGREDLEKKIIRAIGDPQERIREDRLRMVRAIRLSCRFHFQIEEKTAEAIRTFHKELFPSVAMERIWQEFVKGHSFGKLRPMIIALHEFGLLATIFPSLEGVSLEEIKERLLPIKDYPKEAPLIAFFLPLFPNVQLEEQIQIGKKLKIANVETQFITFLFRARELCFAKRLISLAEWAYFYANPFSFTTLQIMSAHLEPKRQQLFLKEHEERMVFLHPSVERIRNHDPIVKSKDLMQEGILPGKAMGLLLEKGDELAINQQIFEPNAVIALLKKSGLWPNS